MNCCPSARGSSRPRATQGGCRGPHATSLIEDGLRLIINDKRKVVAKRRVLPRVSKAEGGLVPGVDLDKASAIDEADDLDYVRRLQHGK